MTTQTTTYASDSGHYYKWDGTPAYTLIGKNGKERSTTVRDARQLDLVPSVTEVMKVMAKPGLERWKMQQVLMASLTLPMLEDETLEAYAVRVMTDSMEQTRKACDRGTEIHGELEKYFTGKQVLAQHLETCCVVESALIKRFGVQPWGAEKSFAYAGYGGKCDLHSKTVVVDFKTKEFTADNLPKPFDEHAMQLSAYRNGLPCDNDAECAIVYVSSIEPLCHIVDIGEEALDRGWAMFSHCLDLWKATKKYYPKEV